MTASNLSFPFLRTDTELAVRRFADREYQKNHWNDNHGPPSNYNSDFDEQFHTLFDDREGLADDPHSTIGSFLLDVAEADAMKELIAPLSNLLKIFGPTMTPRQAMLHPLWEDVVRKATVLRQLFDSANFKPPML